MNKTPNYQLNQWEADDRVQRIDFNADNAKIDAAIKAVDGKADTKAAQSELAALQTTVNGLSGSKADKSALTSLQSTVSAVSARAGSAVLATGRLSAAAESFALSASGVDWSKYSAAILLFTMPSDPGLYSAPFIRSEIRGNYTALMFPANSSSTPVTAVALCASLNPAAYIGSETFKSRTEFTFSCANKFPAGTSARLVGIH